MADDEPVFFTWSYSMEEAEDADNRNVPTHRHAFIISDTFFEASCDNRFGGHNIMLHTRTMPKRPSTKRHGWRSRSCSTKKRACSWTTSAKLCPMRCQTPSTTSPSTRRWTTPTPNSPSSSNRSLGHHIIYRMEQKHHNKHPTYKLNIQRTKAHHHLERQGFGHHQRREDQNSQAHGGAVRGPRHR